MSKIDVIEVWKRLEGRDCMKVNGVDEAVKVHKGKNSVDVHFTKRKMHVFIREYSIDVGILHPEAPPGDFEFRKAAENAVKQLVRELLAVVPAVQKPPNSGVV